MTRSDVEERRSALERDHPTWRPMTIAQALDAAAERYPNRPYVLTDDRTHTYSEMVDWSRRLAAGLIALGVGAGDRVAMVMANYPEYIATKYAIARAGAIAVPLNFLLRRDELAYVLEQSEASVLVTMDSFRDLDYTGALKSLVGRLDGTGGDRFPSLRHIVTFSPDGHQPPAGLDLPALERTGQQAGNSLAGRSDPGRADAVSDILYTSGTTGRPKGVMLTHDMVLRSAYGSALTRAFEDGRRILFALPLYHVFAYVEGMLAALFAGGAIIPQPAFDPGRTLADIERHRATEALFVPTMTAAVLDHPDLSNHDLSSLLAVMSAAAPAPVWLWERTVSELGLKELFTGYGMTETSAATTLTLPGDPLEVVSGTVGRPKLGGVAGSPAGMLDEYRTVDPFTGEPLDPGQEGELACRGPIVTTGYYGKPEETAAAIRDGWLRSGDLGRIRPNGYIELTGRSKELYKCGGELVAPKEVEELLTGHPDVAQAYVVGLPDERMGEVGCAWVVPAPGRTPNPEELIQLCRERLARFKVPRHVLLAEAASLPTTATGKVQKFRLIENAKSTLSRAAR
jgi:fatty-acyl-CoA synthase